MAARKRTTSRASKPPIGTPSGPPAPRSLVVIVVSAALVVMTIAAYTPVWRFDFVALDDPQYVYGNPHIADGLSMKSVGWAFTTGREANWHPLTWLSHAVDIELYGLSAGGHHVTNLVLHLASTLLLFGVLRRMTASLWRSAFVAAVFAVHPLHVESVAWVAERKDVLSGLFFMLALGAYVRYAEAATARRYTLVALWLTLGLMSKPMLVTLPIVLLLLDYWPLGRSRQQTWGRLVREKLPLFALTVASSVATFLVQREGGAVKDFESFPLALRIQNAIVSYLNYLVDVIWPAGLGTFYPFPPSVPAGAVIAAGVVMLGATVAAFRLARRAPYVLVGWLWYGVMLLPVIGIIQVGGQARADRYMYLPIIGLAIAIAWGATAIVRTTWSRHALAAAGAAVILLSAGVAHRQVQHWRDTVAIWSHTAAVTEGMHNFGVYFGLAEYLRETGRSLEAIPQYEAAIARRPSYTDAHAGLVRALLDAKQPTRAIAALQEAVRVNPSWVESRVWLGRLLVEAGQPQSAIPLFAEAVRLQPNSADGHWRLALARAATGNLAEALPAFAEAARLAPGAAPIRNDYGWTLARHGQPAAAMQQLTEALRLDPRLVEAHHNIGRLLAAEGRMADALKHLSEAVRLEPDFVDARLTLAVTLIRSGSLEDGVAELREVLRRDPGNQAARRALAAVGR